LCWVFDRRFFGFLSGLYIVFRDFRNFYVGGHFIDELFAFDICGDLGRFTHCNLVGLVLCLEGRNFITVFDVGSCLSWFLWLVCNVVVDFLHRSVDVFNVGVEVWLAFVLRH
jgi:hypothetical protein